MDMINKKPVSEIQKEKNEALEKIENLEKENVLLKGCVMEIASIVYATESGV